MKLMNIVVSSELVFWFFFYCCVVVLGDIDFMDVAVVVIIAVDSCSGIFVLFKCIGFYLLVFLYFEYVVELFVGVMVVINGNEQ